MAADQGNILLHIYNLIPARRPVAKLTRQEREGIAHKRLLRVLEAQGVANARTLEQKISDAGPNPQRVNPHILTPVRNALVKENRIVAIQQPNARWFHRTDTAANRVADRLRALEPIFGALMAANLQIGQTLEIATYRALLNAHPVFLGRFRDLDEHDDATLYSKEEPSQHIGGRSLTGKQRLDFIVIDREAGALGIECKNVREWLYPNRNEIIETALKCITLDCIPVLIARRVPYVSFRLLNTCGFVIHQTFNQLLPNYLDPIAQQAKHKDNLGYHDIRVGNEPDARLTKFIARDMAPAAIAARPKFDRYKDLLTGFATRDLTYREFAARVRRRENGQNEDHDWPEPEPPDDWWE